MSHAQLPHALIIGPRSIPVRDLVDASHAYQDARHQSGAGSSGFPQGFVTIGPHDLPRELQRPRLERGHLHTGAAMKILIACEYSGTVRRAFAALGHDVVSCDLLPSEDDSPFHYQGPVQDLLAEGGQWDMMIAHPPCTYLCSSGLHWNKRVAGRAELTEQAVQFVELLIAADIPRIAIENPVGCLSTRIRQPDQIIQPYQFGDDASKATCLWLRGLPVLRPTSYVQPRIINGKNRWGNQTDGGQNKLAPSEDRWKERSRTYPGIADAMAQQWGKS